MGLEQGEKMKKEDQLKEIKKKKMKNEKKMK